MDEIEDFAETLIESLKQHYQSPLEPFEAYAERIKLQFQDNQAEFRKRFSHGYEVLMKEINQAK